MSWPDTGQALSLGPPNQTSLCTCPLLLLLLLLLPLPPPSVPVPSSCSSTDLLLCLLPSLSPLPVPSSCSSSDLLLCLLPSLCSALSLQTEMDSPYFLETLAGSFMDVVQYNQDNRQFEVGTALHQVLHPLMGGSPLIATAQ